MIRRTLQMLPGAKNFQKALRARLERDEFLRICHTCNIRLDPVQNTGSLSILKEVFCTRAYSDYFPFYQKATILDIGAHKGYFSLFSALNTTNRSRIIAIEPSRENYQTLCNNLSYAGIHNVEPQHCGISSASGGGVLFCSDESANHTLISPSGASIESSNGRNEKITLLSLEDILDQHNLSKVDFLKLDCEGMEYEAVFSTNSQTLSKIKVISMEFHDRKDERYTGATMCQFLEAHGFSIQRFVHEPTSVNKNYGKIIAARTN